MPRLWLALALALLCGGTHAIANTGTPDWSGYRTTFISNDGRVVDNANGQISHTEGNKLLIGIYFLPLLAGQGFSH